MIPSGGLTVQGGRRGEGDVRRPVTNRSDGRRSKSIVEQISRLRPVNPGLIDTYEAVR